MNAFIKKQLLPVITKLLITAGLITLVYSQIELDKVIAKVTSTDFTFLFFAFICHIIAYALYATRYTYLLRQLTIVDDYAAVFKWYYFGLFCNNYLPTSFGGDVVRIYALKKQNYSLGNLIVSSFADRLIGISSIFLMGFVALIFNPLLISIDSTYLGLIAISLIIMLSACFAFLRFLLTYKTVGNGLIHKLARKADEMIRILRMYKDKSHELLLAFFTSFMAQLFIMLSYTFLGLSLDLNLRFFSYFAIIPIVFLASAIPITIGGLGIREGTLISLLSLYYVSYDDAAALSLLYLLLITVITLPAVIVPSMNRKNLKVQISLDSQ